MFHCAHPFIIACRSRTRLVNEMKRHSAANFDGQSHVVNGFVKLVPDMTEILFKGRKFASPPISKHGFIT